MAEFRQHTDLHVIDVPVSELSQHPDNANNGDMDALEESIRVNGFYQPIIAQLSTGFVLAGNHRLAVAQKLGADTIPTIYVDVDDDGAKRLMVADNRITRLGRDDDAQLALLLDSLSETDYGLLGTGYTATELQDLLEQMDQPLEFDQEPGGSGGSGHSFAASYLVTPEKDDAGNCHRFIIEADDLSALTAEDFTIIRKALSMPVPTRKLIEGFGIEGW